MKAKILGLLAVALLAGPMAANAYVIATNGPSNGSSPWMPGASLTTGTGGGWNNISFNFYNTDGTTEASGSLFILTNTYAGTPSGLSSATSGFLAQSISAIGGVWQFDPSVTLNANTQYWFLVGTGFSWDTSFGRGGNVTAGGGACFATSEGTDYFSCDFSGVGRANWDYLLQGTVVPEPGTLALLGLGLAGLGLSRRRKAN